MVFGWFGQSSCAWWSIGVAVAVAVAVVIVGFLIAVLALFFERKNKCIRFCSLGFQDAILPQLSAFHSTKQESLSVSLSLSLAFMVLLPCLSYRRVEGVPCLPVYELELSRNKC